MVSRQLRGGAAVGDPGPVGPEESPSSPVSPGSIPTAASARSAEPAAVPLVIVTQWFWPETIGSPLYMTDVAQWMTAAFPSVTVLTQRPFYPHFRVFDGYAEGQRDREEALGVHIQRLPTYVPLGGGFGARLKNEGLFLVRALIAILTGKVARSPRVLSLCPSILAVLAGSVATRRGGRHVAVVHDIQSGLAAQLGMIRAGATLRVLRWLERTALNRASAVVVLSERMKEALIGQGVTAPITVLPIWVDPDRIRPLPRLALSPPTVMYSGNLGRKQGIEQVLAMATVLKDRRPEVRVLIRGSGVQAEAVRREIAEHQLDNVVIEDLVPAERLNESLAEADVHLVPQNPTAADFAVPSKVYSIMAAGRPFVCTAVEGSTLWLLAEATSACTCVPPNEPTALADAVLALLDDPARAASMGARGRAYVEANASRTAVLSRYEALLKG